MTPSPAPTTSRTNPNRRDGTNDWWLVFRKFLRHGTSIATFAPSSKHMARSICNGIDFDRAKCIVELGAGTGPITEELVRRVKSHTRLVIVELDPDFCVRLRAKFPNADIVEGDAAELDKLLADRGITQVDHVVSGLPLPSFPAALRQSILTSSAKSLSPGGTFRQLTITPWYYWKMYRGYFSDVRFRLVPINFPPGGVYVCSDFRAPN